MIKYTYKPSLTGLSLCESIGKSVERRFFIMPKGVFTRHPELTNEERFWLRVGSPDNNGCRQWLGFINENGYGTITFKGHTEKAHRVAFELSGHKLLDGYDLDHLCRNRGCVNPDHLEVVDRRTNLLRGVGSTARYAQRTYCDNGHEFNEENTYLHPNGARYCRICKSEYRKRYYQIERK